MHRETKKKQSEGFTLIELIIYIALISIFITGAVYFAWDVIYGRVKSRVQQEVSQNLRLAQKRINFEIKNASDLISVTSNQICLLSADRGPITFYNFSGVLMVGWGGSCDTPTNSYSLTSNTVNLSNIQFEDLSSVDQASKNIWYSLTIESTGDRQEWEKSETYSTSVELRSN